MGKKTLNALYSEGVPIDLPPRFTISADTELIDKALRALERGNKALEDEEAVIVYDLFSGYGGIEKFHRVCAASRAREILKEDREGYGTITYGWLRERKLKILSGKYRVRGGIFWG